MPSHDSLKRLTIGGATIVAVLSVVCVIAPAFTAWHRSQLADHLADQVADSNDSAVKVPLRQLAQLGPVGLKYLVVAAASERATVSTIAQQIIDEKMAAWQLLATSRPTQTVELEFTADVNVLAATLATHIHRFGPAGKQWGERLALVMIDYAGILPVRQSAALLADCSEIFTAVPPRGPIVRTVTSLSEAAAAHSTQTLNTPPLQLEPLTRASDGSLETLTRLEPRSTLKFQGRLAQEPAPNPPAFNPPPRVASDLHWASQPKNSRDQPPPPPPDTVVKHNEPTPITNPEPEPAGKRVLDVPSPAEMQDQADVLRRVSTDELMVRLNTASFFQAGIVRQVLRERGLTDVDFQLMNRLVSREVDDRLRLVEDASVLPAARARRLLVRLLADPSADVRLRALTALATTHSSELIEMARALALHDKDPRVSKLAARLLRQVR